MRRLIHHTLWVVAILVTAGYVSTAYGLDRKTKCVKFTAVDHLVASCEREINDCHGYCEAIEYPKGECRRATLLHSCRQWNNFVGGKLYAGSCFSNAAGICKCAYSHSDFRAFVLHHPSTDCI
jgi:hypothetical protein